MKWTPRVSQNTRTHVLPIGERTLIMGILNTSEDSFSGDGISGIEEACSRALKMEEDGADIIDIGGQSTRPGAARISSGQEMERTSPVIKQVAAAVNIPVSIDTYKSVVASEAVKNGAAMVNDISGLRFDSDMAGVVSESGVPVIVMHIRGTPEDMQTGEIIYDDVLARVKEYLAESVKLAVRAGIQEDMIIVDPGIGFGKTVKHNLVIINRLNDLKTLKTPILIGTSRKSLIGKVLDLPAGERLEGTAATVALSIARGADIVRVHDVKEMKRVAVMSDAIVRETG